MRKAMRTIMVICECGDAMHLDSDRPCPREDMRRQEWMCLKCILGVTVLTYPRQRRRSVPARRRVKRAAP
jgi:hypothetical protein